MNKPREIKKLGFAAEVTDAELVYIKLKFDWSSDDIRILLAVSGQALNHLYNDSSSIVRGVVARHQYKLDILMKDYNPVVRVIAKDQHRSLAYENAKSIADSIFNEAGCK